MSVMGVVFDLDGTLVLSHHDFARMREEIVRTAQGYGVDPDRLSVREVVGTSQILRSARREMEALNVPPDAVARFDAEVASTLDVIEMEALPRTVPRVGAQALLRGLHDRGVRLGLFTRSSEVYARAALWHTGLGPFFSSFRTRSDPGPAKPAPEALYILLRAMGVPRWRARFVGDHLEDAECARRAGVLFCGVLPDPQQPNATTAETFLARDAVGVAEDLDGIARLLGVAVPER